MALRADDVDLGRDRGLVERFQAGDSAAFDDLYRRYFPRLYRFCLKRVGDAYEAEEVAQEAFTRAYLHLDQFAGERRFYPWVSVIASRLCVDTHRRRARSQPTDEVPARAVDGGQEAVLQGADLVILDQAFSQLAPRHREVLNLRERQGFSYQRIADHYGVSLGTVEALLWRARRALRREFLNLTNGEVPAIAALPGAGLGLSRLARWRTRLLTWLHANGQPLAAAVTALVVAGTTGAIVGGAAHTPTGAKTGLAATGVMPVVLHVAGANSTSTLAGAAGRSTGTLPASAGPAGTHTRARFVAISTDSRGVHASTAVHRTRADVNTGVAVADTVSAVHRYVHDLSIPGVSGQ